MAYISQITLPSGDTYDIRAATERPTTLTVGTSNDSDITYNANAITTPLNRVYARKQGSICIFSFVATLVTGTIAANTTLFTINEDFRPTSTVDFLMWHSNEGIIPATLNNTSGVISSYKSMMSTGYTIRGEVTWVIE